MPRTLFQELVPEAGGAGSWRALPLSLALHAAAVTAGALLVRPTAAVEAEPPRGPLTWVEERARPRVVPAAPQTAAPRPRAGRSAAPAPLPEPVRLDLDPVPLAELESGVYDTTPAPCLVGCGSGDAAGEGTEQGAGEGVSGGGNGAADEPRAIGGELDPPRKTRHVVPAYPELARRTGVGGSVVVECVIDVDGQVSQARVLRGHPLLDGAALEAVRQWRYEPTRLNGVPVPVLLTVTVSFVVAR
jgi:protein TonB